MEYRKLIQNKSDRKVPVFSIITFLICFIFLFVFMSVLLRFVFLRNHNAASIKTKSMLNKDIEAASSSQRLIGGCQSGYARTYDDNFPDKFDWRNRGVIGDVINQLQCNACWEISIIGVMESMVGIGELAYGAFHGVISLSVQEIIDCSYRKGCILGDPRAALEDIMEKNMSIVTAKEYPMTLRDEDCKIPEDSHPKGVSVKHFRVLCNVSADEMMSIIYHHGPVVVTVNSSPFIYYTDGVISRDCSLGRSDHVVQIVGYDRTGTPPYYTVKNSWGTDFGLDGYLKVEMGNNMCGIEEYVTLIDVQKSR